MTSFKTGQEEFWSGKFGTDYIERNRSRELLASNLHLFSRVLERSEPIGDAFEIGCNIGMNLRALELLAPNCALEAIEINENAAEEAAKISNVRKVHKGSILDFEHDGRFDLVFTKGVLIHINPDYLEAVYRSMANLSRRYVLIAEYYNPKPVSVEYRGESDKLFKRDFAGEFMSVNQDFTLVDFAFHYKKAYNFSQDDITWFLMRRR